MDADIMLTDSHRRMAAVNALKRLSLMFQPRNGIAMPDDEKDGERLQSVHDLALRLTGIEFEVFT